METPLEGGNTHDAVVRVGDTVRRPVGAATPGVHALLRHLEAEGFDGAPRLLGFDEVGRESLTFVEGDVVWPHHAELLDLDDALVEVGQVVRAYHDAAAGFPAGRWSWSDRGGDPTGPAEVLCHNDLAAWNLVRTTGGWTFIDWDLAAPGRVAWDIAWAVLSLVPLMPDHAPADARVVARLRAFGDGYGRDAMPDDVLDVAVERCRREAELIRTLGEAGEAPYDRLLAEGHGEVWAAAAEHVATCATRWQSWRS